MAFLYPQGLAFLGLTHRSGTHPIRSLYSTSGGQVHGMGGGCLLLPLLLGVLDRHTLVASLLQVVELLRLVTFQFKGLCCLKTHGSVLWTIYLNIRL